MSADKHSPEDIALSLTLAIVTSSPAPLLLLDGQLTIIAASTSFCTVFGATTAQLLESNGPRPAFERTHRGYEDSESKEKQ